ncbi:MAG: U32 family peptidase [Erysipelotrichaceae bacterium]
MNQFELLAPVGSWDALVAAVQNGCDAIYLGGRKFGARAFADNFDHELMGKAIAYAHQYDVSVYVTINTLLFEDEMHACLDYIEELVKQDVDALIIQDLGLLTSVHQQFPDLELHASTQMHIHNQDGVEYCKQIGLQRAVLARETSIEEIRSLSKCGIELEVFIHGALCVCYSGQCYMSANMFDRSGNRGTCAQPCRMLYSLMEGKTFDQLHEVKNSQGYLLSLKDLYTLDHMHELMEAGVTSFKIEGRMKSGEYVGQVVHAYREAMDAYIAHKKYQVKDSTKENLMKVFNRGFTPGHIFHARGSDLGNRYRPNHMGVEIGEVISCDRKFIKVKLSKDLHQGDGIRFIQKHKEDDGFIVQRLYNEKGLLIKAGKANDIICFDCKKMVEKGATCIKSSDVLLKDELRRTYESNHRLVSLYGHVSFRIGKKIELSMWDDHHHHISVTSDEVVEKAIKSPIDSMRLKEQFSKLGNTIFTLKNLDIEMDENASMAIRSLNELRRAAIIKMEEARKEVHHSFLERQNFSLEIKQPSTIPSLLISVDNKEQYDVAKALGCEVIFAPIAYEETTYIKKSNVNHRQNKCFERAMIAQVGDFNYISKDTYAYKTLNVTNATACARLFQLGVKGIMVSNECNNQQIKALINEFEKQYGFKPNLVKEVYGQEELMVSEHCLIAMNKGLKKKHCGLCQQGSVYGLKDKKNRIFPVTTDAFCLMHLWDQNCFDELDQLKDYKQMGLSTFCLSFHFESSEQTKSIIKKYQEAMLVQALS